MDIFVDNWGAIGKYSLSLAVGILLGLLFHFVLYRIGRRFAERTEIVVDDAILSHFRRPLLLFFPLVFLVVASTPFDAGIPEALSRFVNLTTEILLTVSIAWMVVKVAYVLEDYLMRQYRMDVRDNLKARKIHTQLQLVKKLLAVIVGILALGVILMNFDKFRELGTGILASAGLAGIIIGFAAQRTLANLLAGFQIAITQPIRLDDVVIVEGEWGWIEEITLTYVVVRIWDLRRLVLPISYFIEKPFQNWTRESADILGTVYLYADYTIPIDTVRRELHKILKESEYWDGKVWRLHTTNTTEKTVELRALMSAVDSSSAWELRCEVREKLIGFVQRNYPESLPKVRAEFEKGG